MRDVGGTLFPDKGFVKSAYFQANQDIRLGIFGYKISDIKQDTIINLPKGKFAVVKITDTCVDLQYPYGSVKFEQGYVIMVDTLALCLKSFLCGGVG